MPGPTYAPFFAAIGTFLLFLGLVFGGPILVLGLIVLAPDPPLLGPRGAHRLRPRRRRPSASCRPSSTTGPPPGVHMPGPSFRPILAALGRRRPVRRPRVRRLGPRGRPDLHDRGPARLARRRPQGIPPGRPGGRDRPPRERAGAGLAEDVLPRLRDPHRRRGRAHRGLVPAALRARAATAGAGGSAAPSRRRRADPAARAPAGSRSPRPASSSTSRP